MPNEPRLTAATASKALRGLANPEKPAFLERFFKCGPGEYGEGDVFIGVSVPTTREVARQFKGMSLGEVSRLLSSKIHEERLLALIILCGQYKRADVDGKKSIYDLYVAQMRHINNWDLVDTSAPHIVGDYLLERDRKILYRWAQSKRLWDRRVAILATQHFIRNDDFAETLALAKLLLEDKEDLMHKAVGWMLREMGKKDLKPLEAFLKKHCRVMPRTMLRYSIEKLPESKRRAYMSGNF